MRMQGDVPSGLAVGLCVNRLRCRTSGQLEDQLRPHLAPLAKWQGTTFSAWRLSVRIRQGVPNEGIKLATVEEFMWWLARRESRRDYTAQNKKTKAYGAFQILPGNWKEWAPKALNTDPSLAVATKGIPPDQWIPTPTEENQNIVANWRITGMLRRLCDFRRVAAVWRVGVSIADKQPGDTRADGTHFWSNATIRYVNEICFGFVDAKNKFRTTLGLEQVTRETVIPDDC